MAIDERVCARCGKKGKTIRNPPVFYCNACCDLLGLVRIPERARERQPEWATELMASMVNPNGGVAWIREDGALFDAEGIFILSMFCIV